MGFDLTETVRQPILALDESAWRPAVRQAGEARDGAWVTEITEALELSGWPGGTRVIVRRERPHPGAQLSFTDHDGHRFLATLDGEAVERIAPAPVRRFVLAHLTATAGAKKVAR
jgi:hypothetical protein